MTWDVTRLVEPAVRPGCKTAVGDLGPWIKSIKVRRPFGGKASFQAQFFQYAGAPAGADDEVTPGLSACLQLTPATINPYPSGGSYGVLPHNYTMARRVSVTFDVAGMIWSSPVFLPGSPHFDGQIMTWSGEDQTVLLEKDNQKMPDIIADQTPPVMKMAKATIQEICAQYGIRQVTCNFPDYMIRLLRRTAGRPIDWVDAIGRPYQAFRHWREGALVIEPAGRYSGNTWSFIDELNIEQLSLYIDDGIKNKFTITRGEPQPGIIGEQECIGGRCLGRTVDITLDPPSMSCQPHIEIVNGKIDDFVFFDKEDNVLPAPGAGGIYLGNPPAARVKATYYPPLGATTPGGNIFGGNAGSLNGVPWTPRYHITYFGGGAAGSPGLSNKYTFTKTDSSGTVSVIGVREEYGNIEDPIIPNETVAKAALDAILYENSRRIWRAQFRTPYFNPFIEPGDSLLISDLTTGLSGIRWFVEEVRLSYEAAGGPGEAPQCYVEIDASRGVV